MEEFDFHSQKPDLIEPKSKGGLSVTIFSMVLFVLAFVLLFAEQINFILYLLVVLVIHELGHFIMMKKFDYKNVRMLFVPLMGAFVQGKKEEYSQKESFWVTIAGPLPGIIIGILLFLYSVNNHSVWGLQLSFLFLLLNVLNLMPLDPLDGGQLFKLFIRKKQELFILIFALVSSLLLIGAGWMLDSIIIILFGFFMGFRVRSIQKRYYMHKELNEEKVNYSTTYKLLTNRDFVKIKRVVLDHTPALRQFIDQVSTDEADPVIANQVNNVLVAPVKRDASFIFRAMIVLFWLASVSIPFYLFLNLDLTWYNGI
jgi:Zn-dependent protease